MADVISELATPNGGRREAVESRRGPAELDLIELLFFAYRDFVSDPDTALADYGFGRAHHRVLHFVSRNPGMRVADILDILRITKQSLGRVLKQLIDAGFVAQRPGPRDRRERLLYATAAGDDLADRLMRLQARRIRAALAGIPAEQRPAIRAFLRAMIDEGERAKAARLIER